MKRLFFLSGISILGTIIICETAWYYGFESSLLPISAFIAALIGAIFLFSTLPGISISVKFKKCFITISSCIIIGVLLWSFSNYRYQHLSTQCLSSKNTIYTVSDKVNIKTYNGYLTNIICNDTGAVISFKTDEKLAVVPDDLIIANITKSIDQKNRTYNRSNGINLVGETKGRIISVKNSDFSFNRIFFNIRHEISKHVGLDAGKVFGFLNALILGDKSGLSYDEKTVLQSAGVYHVCAVSGLHVSIVAIFLGYIISFFKIKKTLIKLLITLPALFIILAVTGFSVSALRAVFMATAILFGKSFYRKADSLNILGVILTLILLISPFSAFSPSLLLTFSATTGIILLSSGLKKEIITGIFLQTGHILSKHGGYFVGILSVSIAATTFTAIVSEVFFSNTNVVGVFANLIVLQLVTIVYLLAIIMIIFSFIPFCAPITLLFSQLVTIGVNLIMTVSSIFANSFLAKTDLKLGTIIVCALIAAVVAGFYYFKNMPKPKKVKKKYIGYSAAVFAITFIVSLFGGTAIKAIFDPDDGLYHIAYIDVGQGMSSVLSYGNHAVIIDCGGSKNVSYAINNYLHSKSIRNIDTIIVSHLHSDHCNALNTLLDEWNVGEVIIPYTEGDPAIYVDLIETADIFGTEVIEIDSDDTRKLGDMSVFILTNHLNDENTDQNDNCLAIIAEIAEMRGIFPGDLTEVSEETITELYSDFLDCNFLSVPHHGSKYSSSKLFLEAISPEISIISVGKNTYGHPSNDTLERIVASGSNVMTTLEYGTIEIITDGIDYNVVYGK